MNIYYFKNSFSLQFKLSKTNLFIYFFSKTDLIGLQICFFTCYEHYNPQDPVPFLFTSSCFVLINLDCGKDLSV